MKKEILLTRVILLLFVSNQLLAQHPESTGFADVKGMNFINAGVGLGTGYPYDYKTSGSTVDVDLHAGGRYLFTEHVGAYAELGYGISPLQVGLSFKF